MLSTSPTNTIIYCRTTTQPAAGVVDFAIKKQEATCRKYAEKNDISVGMVFRDLGTELSPKSRDGFMELCDYVRDAEKPIMVLVENYFVISPHQHELTDAFYLLKNTYGAQVYDIQAIDRDVMLHRFLHEAKLDQSMLDVMDFLKLHEEQCAKYYNQLYEITNEMELIP